MSDFVVIIIIIIFFSSTSQTSAKSLDTPLSQPNPTIEGTLLLENTRGNFCKGVKIVQARLI